MDRFSKFIQPNNLIQFISMRGNKISDSNFSKIAEKFPYVIALHELDLSYNKITDESLPIIKDNLLYNKSITGINLSNNCLKANKYIQKIIFSLLQLLEIYMSFKLNDSKLRDEIISSNKSNFKEINGLFGKRKAILASNPAIVVTDELPVQPAISPAKINTEVSGNNTLTYLNLYNNPIEEETILQLIKSLEEITYPISLSYLNVENNRISQSKLDELNEILKKKSNSL